jgi:formylglycine-generating enzyme required for sulfatase activity
LTVLVIILLVFIPYSYAGDEFISKVLDAKFVLVSAGTFTMGGSGSDEKQHLVTISKPFYIQITEITQGQYQKVMGINPSYFKDCDRDCPVESVSWNDVQKFIRKLNLQEGTDKYRLPTEAEWEYAARSGGKRDIDAGIGGEFSLAEYAWYNVNSDQRTHPVGKKKPNDLGLYDMGGNVWEWCQDTYWSYPSGSVKDPMAHVFGRFRVFRGCSWSSVSGNCRSAARNFGSPSSRDRRIGFRLVRTP